MLLEINKYTPNTDVQKEKKERKLANNIKQNTIEMERYENYHCVNLNVQLQLTVVFWKMTDGAETIMIIR